MLITVITDADIHLTFQEWAFQQTQGVLLNNTKKKEIQ